MAVTGSRTRAASAPVLQRSEEMMSGQEKEGEADQQTREENKNILKNKGTANKFHKNTHNQKNSSFITHQQWGLQPRGFQCPRLRTHELRTICDEQDRVLPFLKKEVCEKKGEKKKNKKEIR